MKTFVCLSALICLALLQAGCSQRTQEASKVTADSAAKDAKANMAAAGDVLQAGAADAADKVSEGAANLRDKIDAHESSDRKPVASQD